MKFEDVPRYMRHYLRVVLNAKKPVEVSPLTYTSVPVCAQELGLLEIARSPKGRKAYAKPTAALLALREDFEREARETAAKRRADAIAADRREVLERYGPKLYETAKAFREAPIGTEVPACHAMFDMLDEIDAELAEIENRNTES